MSWVWSLLLVLIAATPAQAAMLLTDSFGRAAETPIASPWVANIGSYNLLSSQVLYAVQSGGDAEEHHGTAPGTANYFVGIKIIDKYSSVFSGPAGRMPVYTAAAARSLYRISVQASNTWNLDEIISNVSTTIVTATQSWSAGDRIVLKVFDTDKSMYLNGVQVGGTSASNGLTSASFGGLRDGGIASSYDNFVVADTLSEADCFANTGTTVGCGASAPGGPSGKSLLGVGN